MKNIFKNTAVIFFLLMNPFSASSQDFTFSQFYEMPLLRNPAIAGIFVEDVRVQTAYRTQWESVTVPYKTMAISAEVKFPGLRENDFFTAGLQVTNDVAGDANLSRIQVLPAVNYLFSLNETDSYLSAGFMGGFVQSQFDPTKMTFDDQFQNGQFNPNNVSGQTFKNTSRTYFDMSAGLALSGSLGNSNQYYIGAAAYHVNKPKVSFVSDSSILKPRMVLNAGINMPLSDYDNFYIYGDYIKQADYNQGLMGMLYGHALGDFTFDEEGKTCIYIGGFYRWADALIPVVKLEFSKLAIGLSYDVNISQLKTASQYRGGFEITGAFKSFLNIRNSTRGSTNCARF